MHIYLLQFSITYVAILVQLTKTLTDSQNYCSWKNYPVNLLLQIVLGKSFFNRSVPKILSLLPISINNKN